ncbi:hypothetical protein AA101099_2675 [Neoasaia chiangmaiensis NBRC 101099]|uniref:Uncharacterized protein n=1 Tax=Neoasaia chiangmaiensis TaxID=320497 RepID=A0A1U9KPD5_9PROT|nr:hypothetical protein [Neoasaia chiangmaiensis]AQS87664.1 hypothetical protein A0U93_06670 [Neoasaia chiangmaiensis]GBR41919.1 hypothetical protein AA101099_2675 [Neoasaia chiangmaiensis NBRC 101099]GEN14247.1 hypothetical protein NCH01_06780 [Neoasaia chiangmaiensis]
MLNRQILLSALSEFGALALVWLMGPHMSPHLAFAATVGVIMVSAWRRRRDGRTRAWWTINGLALSLALLPLLTDKIVQSFYQAALANILCAGAFAFGASGPRSLLQEFAEARQGFSFDPGRTDISHFLRLYTLAWTAFFVLRASIWVLCGGHDGAATFLQLAMPLSFALMLLLSFKGAWVFRIMQRVGLIS